MDEWSDGWMDGWIDSNKLESSGINVSVSRFTIQLILAGGLGSLAGRGT